MKKKLIFIIAAVMLLSVMFSFTASADTGPKPSVNITFQNMGDEICYATLLSSEASWGPARAWDGTDEPAFYIWQGDGDEPEYYREEAHKLELWQTLTEYADSDGFYFLQRLWRVDETKELKWTYYPPDRFKILLYYPETDSFVSSGIYERYAFDSYYTVNMEGVKIAGVNYPSGDFSDYCGTGMELVAEESYDYKWEIISLLARILITVALEISIALLFSYKGKREFAIICATNIITQIILNVGLNILNYTDGYMAFTACYIFFEIIVFALEAAVYSVFIKEKKKSRNILYALTSNAVSFGVGLFLAHMIPGIF